MLKVLNVCKRTCSNALDFRLLHFNYDVFYFLNFCILSTFLDAMTIYKLKPTLDQKSRISCVNRSKENEMRELRGILTIVFNSLANFLFRFPEILLTIFFSLILQGNKKYWIKRVCFEYQQCLSFYELSNIFYIISLSFNIYFYYLFNKSFKISLKYLKGVIVSGIR